MSIPTPVNLESTLDRATKNKNRLQKILADNNKIQSHFFNWLNNKNTNREGKRCTRKSVSVSINTLTKYIKAETDKLGTCLIHLEVFDWGVRNYEDHLSEMSFDRKQLKFDKENAKSWFLYYFQLVPNSDQPKLGRAILWIDRNDICLLENPKKNNRPNFIGKCERPSSEITNFVLRAENKKKEYLDIQIYPCEKTNNNDFSIGSYLTYEHGFIVTGRLVLLDTDYESHDYKPPQKKPALLDHKHKDWLSKTLIGVRKFLSLRRTNYNRLTNSRKTVDSLESFIDSTNVQIGGRSRMIQVDKSPTIYMSWSQSFKDKHKEFLTDFTNHLLKHGQIQQIYNSPLKENPFIIGKNVEAIKRSSLVICFLDSPEHCHSLSTVEIGLGLAYAKAVLVFYRHDDNQKTVSLHLADSIPNSFPISDFSTALSACKVTVNTVLLRLNQSV